MERNLVMKKYQTILGWFFLVVAVIILVNLTDIVYPTIGEDGIDTNQYFLEVILNALRYIVLSMFSFILGLKCLFQN